MLRKLLLFSFFLSIFTLTAQTNLSGFLPSNSNSGIRFGWQTALHDDTYVVSSQTFSSTLGKVFVFSKVNQVLTQQSVLYADDAVSTDQFGRSIAIFGDYIAVGSPFHDSEFTDSGAVYVYKKIDNVWTFIQKITAFDTSADKNFGSCVKIQGTSLFVSAPNDQNSNSSGSVYVYSYNGTNWSFQQKLTVPLTTELGLKFEVQGNLLVAIDALDAHHTFTYNNSWILSDSTLYIGNLEYDLRDFVLDGERLYITAVSPMNPTDNAVLILNRVNNTWVFEPGVDGNFNDFYIGKIAVSGTHMLVGYQNYIFQVERKFPIRYYKKISNSWVLQTTFYGEGAAGFDDYFGNSIAMQDAEILIGAPEEGIALSTGKAYAFNLNLLSVSSFEKNNIVVYPNPTVNNILFENQTLLEVAQYELFSSSGKLITLSSKDSSFISLENLHSGIYILRTTFENGSFENHKIIKY
ncbi:T9SS type A sorting domain-containing protein [Flavobacterium orientale]|nr:T9SS type A sorting domain-containing protein [Flavobacterium orientale]